MISPDQLGSLEELQPAALGRMLGDTAGSAHYRPADVS